MLARTPNQAFAELFSWSAIMIRQLLVHLIVRRKASNPMEFGAKLDISIVGGWTRLECCSFNAYNEAGYLQERTEWFREIEGHCSSRILAGKIYRNRENLSYHSSL